VCECSKRVSRADVVEGVQIEVRVPNALPRVRKNVDVVRMNRFAFGISIIAIVVLWSGEVGQEPVVGDGPEKEERTFGALLPHELETCPGNVSPFVHL
jgi:hypothetical protein